LEKQSTDSLPVSTCSPVELGPIPISRDSWKGKCQQAKRKSKLMGNQVRAVEASRADWRCRAEKSEQRVAELERELADLKREQSYTG
jgi:hypothetical protein